MSTRDFYNTNFNQFEENLKNDKSIKNTELQEFYTLLDSCDLSTEINNKDLDAAKEKLITETNVNFLWSKNSAGVPKYQYLGDIPTKWHKGEDLGFVIKKQIFISNLCQQTGASLKVIEHELEEIITETDITEKKRRFSKFKNRFKKYYNKKEVAMMWSFRYSDSKDNFPIIEKNKLPFILALPDYGDGKPYYHFKHKLDKNPTVPRTFDTNIDNDVYRPGGHTYPCGKHKNELGLKEIIHRPSKIGDITELPEEIFSYL